MSRSPMLDLVDQLQIHLEKGLENFQLKKGWKKIGILVSAISGIAKIQNLSNVSYGELLYFSGGVEGMAIDISENEVYAILFDQSFGLKAGSEVTGSGRQVNVPVGEEVLGRVVDGRGKPLDGKGGLNCSQTLPIERRAPEIIQRVPVNTPLETGIKVIDALIPIGHGQRQLIIGDRQTGKSAIAIDTIINQKNKGVICIYCAVGQRRSAVEKMIAKLNQYGAMEYTAVVMAEGDYLPGLRFITPYAATSIAEYFMEKGGKALIIYDDLIEHARSYRELSLLLRRPPGREAFPGDIFYIHSRLLERSTHLCPEDGGGSLTALPIVETQEQNISAYIPTNLISITDGQISLSPELFENGVFPAIDIGNSVSRVGGLAQLKAYHDIAGRLRLRYSQYMELESFSRFGVRIEDETYQILKHGRRIKACLEQQQSDPVDIPTQILILFALNEGLFDNIPLESMKKALESVRTASKKSQDALDRIIANRHIAQEERNVLTAVAKEALKGEGFEPDRPISEKEDI